MDMQAPPPAEVQDALRDLGNVQSTAEQQEQQEDIVNALIADLNEGKSIDESLRNSNFIGEISFRFRLGGNYQGYDISGAIEFVLVGNGSGGYSITGISTPDSPVNITNQGDIVNDLINSGHLGRSTSVNVDGTYQGYSARGVRTVVTEVNISSEITTAILEGDGGFGVLRSRTGSQRATVPEGLVPRSPDQTFPRGTNEAPASPSGTPGVNGVDTPPTVAPLPESVPEAPPPRPENVRTIQEGEIIELNIGDTFELPSVFPGDYFQIFRRNENGRAVYIIGVLDTDGRTWDFELSVDEVQYFAQHFNPATGQLSLVENDEGFDLPDQVNLGSESIFEIPNNMNYDFVVASGNYQIVRYQGDLFMISLNGTTIVVESIDSDGNVGNSIVNRDEVSPDVIEDQDSNRADLQSRISYNTLTGRLTVRNR